MGTDVTLSDMEKFTKTRKVKCQLNYMLQNRCTISSMLVVGVINVVIIFVQECFTQLDHLLISLNADCTEVCNDSS